MIPGFERLQRCVFLGGMQGMMAWCAYAVLEFVVVSLLFRFTRPYAVFTPGHWGATGLLISAFLATGILAGSLTGIAVHLLSGKITFARNVSPHLILERAATLTLVFAFAANLIPSPTARNEKAPMLLVCVAFVALLLACIRSETWSRKAGLLGSPWVVSGVLLGLRQEFILFQLQNLAEQLGTRTLPYSLLLIGSLIAAIISAIWLGRRWSARLAQARIFELNWAAPVLALALLAGSVSLARMSAAQASPSEVISKSSQPNVIVIVIDTVRADHLSVYGYDRDTTPNLKKLAEDSAVYDQAFSASDITLTSHATLFTGMYASWHGAHCQPPEATYGRAVEPQVPTLAEVLSAKGYRTLGAAANLYLRPDFGLQRGFQTFRIPRPVPVLTDESPYLLRIRMREVLSWMVDTSQFDRLYARGDDINRTFFDEVRHKDFSDAPFFAFLNYMDAHFPYIPPAPYDRLFPGKNIRLLPDNLTAIQDDVVHGGPLPDAYATHAMSQYDGGIAYMDAQIGNLIQWLKEQKVYDNTMIVVASDHGEAFGEKRLFLHANSTYQNLLHVALLIKFPHNAHKGVVKVPVSLADVAPTLLRALGYQPPPAVQGKDLLDPASLAEPREVFAESFPCPVLHPPECPQGCLIRTVISWPNKFIASSSGKYETYDLSQDPAEDRNLFGSQNPIAQNLGRKLSGWIKTMPVQSGQHLTLDPEAVQRLKSLGYVQ